MASEVLSIAITEAGSSLVGKLKTELRYVTEYNSNVLKFEEELLQLHERRNGVQRDVEKAKEESKEPREEVLGWVRRVEGLEDKCRPLTTNNSTDNKCLMGLFCSRRRTSKQLSKLTEEIRKLREEGSFTNIAHQLPSMAVVPMGPRGTVENIPSRELIKKEVMEALEDDNIWSIGVLGMGGIGKTTLVTKINNELCVTRWFKKVIMVTVSKDPNMKIIQDRIAERLGLKLEEQDMATRAYKLCQRLSSEESVLIILDDVWKPMELGEIGLGHNIEHMPCKLIVTTRNADVCIRMEVQKVIKMDILPEDEAWTLFAAKAGNVAVEMPSLEPTAREIVRRCKGMPLAIATLGSTLRTQKEEEDAVCWASHALQVLREPNAVCLEGIIDEVVTSLRLSYEQLKPIVKQCFLYCCLFPEDYNIRLTDLRNYGIGEGFLKMTSSLAEAQNELLRSVKILKDCCLLLDGEDKSSVKMHDVVRDVAIWIASNDDDGNGFLVNVGGGSKYWPESDKFHTYKRISYMKNYDSVFPDALECPQLRSLLVRDSYLEKNISFEGVKSLLVLDMACRFPKISVSESVSQLKNLRTLYLGNCDLFNKMYLLGGLTKLEVLSMRESAIGELPEEFGNLTNLKFLNLTGADIKFVVPNVFSKLLKMEELLISNSMIEWDTTGELEDDDDDDDDAYAYGNRGCIPYDGSRRKAELKEVLSLPRLSLLDIKIGRPLLDGEVFNYPNLQNFRISVGYDAEKVEEFCCDMNTLYIGSTDLGKHCISKLIAVSSKNMDLILERCCGFKSVTDLCPAGSFNHLQYLRLEKCNEVESVIVAQDSFEKLEKLELFGMDKMERILHGAASSTKFFRKLEKLIVRECSKICTIFPSNLLFTEKRLENLKVVEVEKCDEVQHIFNTEDEEFGATPSTTALLSGVTDIKLSYLTKLKSICNGIMPEGSFQRLTHLSVGGCHSLKHLLPSNMAGLLQNLEEIEIRDCAAMEMIFFPTREETEVTPLFPRCRILKIYSCPKLKNIFSFGVARHVHLEEIEIQDCAAMETIIFPTREEAEETSLLPRCKRLTVDSCPKLKSIFSFCVARHINKLVKLCISHCHGLRQVLGNGDEPRVTMHRCLLPELKYLELIDLMRLIRFNQDNLPICCPLQEIKVFVCPNLTRLPLQTVSALKSIHAEDIWFKKLESEDNSQASILKPFFQAYFQDSQVPSFFYGINMECHPLLWKAARLWLDDYASQLEGTTVCRMLCSARDKSIGDFFKLGVVPCLVEFLTRKDRTQLQSEAAWVLADIASRSSDHTKLAIKHGAVPIFVKLLCSPNEFIREQAICALVKIARDSPEHRDLVLPHRAYLQGHDNSEIPQKAVNIINSFQLEKYTPSASDTIVAIFQYGETESNCVEEETKIENHASKCKQFKVGPGTNNNMPLLRPKPTNQNASKIGLVKKGKQIIVQKDYGMTGAGDPSSAMCLGNAKIDLKYPPSSPIEIAKKRQVDQMLDEEPYARDITSNDSMKFKAAPGTNSNRPFLRRKLTNKNASNIGLDLKRELSIVLKDYGMTGANNPSYMLSLGNAKINLNYPPSLPIEIVEERQVYQLPYEEPYVRQSQSNASVKIDDTNS